MRPRLQPAPAEDVDRHEDRLGEEEQTLEGADRVDLDGVREMVREIHDHGQAGEQQHQRPTNRQSRKFLHAPAGG
jgi:hypothetical protein